MIDYDLEATFWLDNDNNQVVYRNDTKLIFNGDNRVCGIILMLNPGKCLPIGEKEVIKEQQMFSTIKGNLKRDPTQGIIVTCITYFYDNIKLPDSVFIVNLCDKVESQSKKLSEEDFRKKDYNKIIEEIGSVVKSNQIRWIWIAFGKNPSGKDKEAKEYITKLKEGVLVQLKSNELFRDKIVGESAYYCHPLYINCKSKLKDNIKKEIVLKLQNS